ncbi:MAG: helicase-associated domain-containing protein, partial [Acidimicrobiales bacterium]
GPATAGPATAGPATAGPATAGPATAGPATAGPAPSAFREAVAALAPWAPPVSTSFVVQADLTAVAPGELTSAVRSELELLADVESKGAATVYRFSEASLRRGFDAGRSSPQIISFLEEHATRGVPQALSYLVGDLGRRFGALRVGSASCYLRCEDPAMICEILASRRNSKLKLRQLAPTVLVSATDAATTLATLRASGYLPALEDDRAELVILDIAPQRAQPFAKPSWAPGEVDVAALASDLRKAAGPAVAAGSAGPARTAAPARAAGSAGAFGSVGAAGSARAAGAQSPASGLPGFPAGSGRPGQVPPSPAGLPPGLSDTMAEALMGLLDDFLEGAAEGPGSAPAGGLPVRPVAIVKDPQAVLGVLEAAYDEEWMVRLGYTSRNGRTTQLSCVVTAVEDDEVVVEVLPRWDERSLPLDRIEWARVMTEAEEEVLP